jgi:hypothetical protein
MTMKDKVHVVSIVIVVISITVSIATSYYVPEQLEVDG